MSNPIHVSIPLKDETCPIDGRTYTFKAIGITAQLLGDLTVTGLRLTDGTPFVWTLPVNSTSWFKLPANVDKQGARIEFAYSNPLDRGKAALFCSKE